MRRVYPGDAWSHWAYLSDVRSRSIMLDQLRQVQNGCKIRVSSDNALGRVCTASSRSARGRAARSLLAVPEPCGELARVVLAHPDRKLPLGLGVGVVAPQLHDES